MRVVDLFLVANLSLSRIFSKLENFTRGSDMNTDMMTIKEVADYLKITEKTAYRLVAGGEIPGFKVGGSWRFRRTEIDQWIDRQSMKPKGGAKE